MVLDSTSQIVGLEPSPAAARLLLSGENAKHQTNPWNPVKRASSRREAVSHSFTLPSRLPAASILPSEEKVTDSTCPSPLRLSIWRPLTVSQSRSVLSLPPEASVSPWGEKARHRIFCVCPSRVATVFFATTSHRATVLGPAR